MQFKPIVTITALLLVIASLSVAGCVNTASPTPTPTAAPTVAPAAQLSMTAHTDPVPSDVASYYPNMVYINATITNYGNKPVKISNDNFYLNTADGRSYEPMNTDYSLVAESGGSYIWTQLHFNLDNSSPPTQLRYYDGTYDLTCNVT
jgi:hypothetical protein